MDFEGIMLSEIDRERQILYNITYMWNLKKCNQLVKIVEYRKNDVIS